MDAQDHACQTKRVPVSTVKGPEHVEIPSFFGRQKDWYRSAACETCSDGGAWSLLKRSAVVYGELLFRKVAEHFLFGSCRRRALRHPSWLNGIEVRVSRTESKLNLRLV
jgi:hypothetical protein